MQGVIILVGLVVVLVVAGLIIYFITIHNSLVRLRNNIDKSWANVDTPLKQRHDELPKLIETCRGYMQYEQKTLQAVTQARAAYARATTRGDKAQADNLITGALRTLFAAAENYPELKANTNFMQLRGCITELEQSITGQRRRFNEDVNVFNMRIAQIPDVLVARFMNLQPHPLFEPAPADRQDAQVRFT